MTTASDGTIRLGGLTSGFDTESIVQQLLSTEQASIDKLTEKKEINVAKIDTWNDIAEQLKSFADPVSTLRADGTSGNTLFDDKSVSSSSSTTATATASSSAIEAEYSLTVTSLARAHVAYGSQKSTSYTLPAGGDIILGGATITLTAGMTLDDIASTINGGSYVSGKEIEAVVIDRRLVVQTAETGTSRSIHGTTAGAPPFVNATDDASNILQGELGIIDGAGNLVNEAQTAADAAVSINGIAITSESNTLDDVISGVTVNLLTGGGATTTLTVSVETEEIKETIQEFVDSYNELRDMLQRVRAAKLNDEDNFGLFHTDSLLRELFNEVRQLTTGGITMGSSDWDGATVNGAHSTNATSIAMNSFTNAAGTLTAGDEFTISGDDTFYKVQNTATIAGNAATVEINPPLQVALTGGETIQVAVRTLEDVGIGTRTDTVSGVDGLLGVIDEGKLDSVLSSDISLLKRVFQRSDSEEGRTGAARRLYDWIDSHTKISYLINKTRSIDDTKIDGLNDTNDSIDDQVARIQTRMAQKEEALIRQFAEMENAMASAQASGGAISGLAAGG